MDLTRQAETMIDLLSSSHTEEDDISNSADEISKQLASSQSLMNREVPDDGTEEVC